MQADPTQMRQLLQNLIGNALKFHRPDVPPVVRVGERPQPARRAASRSTVADNGIGFETTYEDRIFRVFERLHPRDVYAGTGIGLALCRKIAERHGGTIDGATGVRTRARRSPWSSRRSCRRERPTPTDAGSRAGAGACLTAARSRSCSPTTTRTTA